MTSTLELDEIEIVDDGDEPVPSQRLLAAPRVEPDDHVLRASEKLFRALVETAPDALVICDEAGVILLTNQVAEAVFGYAHGELIGQPIEALVPTHAIRAHRDHRADYMRGPMRRPMGAFAELTARRKDGSEFPVEISLSPVQTPSGTLVTSIVRDITERQRAQEMMRLQGVALASAANGVVITDRRGIIIWANPAFSKMTGWSLAEVIGQTPQLLKSGRHDEVFYQQMWSTISAGHTWHGEVTNRRKDGSLYVEEQTIAPVHDERGALTHFIAIKADVTERRREQAELGRMNERLRQELSEAAAFVRSVLPKPLTYRGVSIEWAFQPSAELGGDGLGYHVRPDGTLALYLLDVCGHGLAAALLSVAVLTALRSGRLAGAQGADPAVLVASLNQAFPSSEHNGLFFTIWYGVFDPATRELRHVSAGHPPPILIEPGREGVELGETGPMVGVAADASWEASSRVLPFGAQLFVFSDGAYELTRPGRGLLSYDNFRVALEHAASQDRPLDAYLSFAKRYCAPSTPDDDLSLMMLRVPAFARRPSSASMSAVKV